MCCLIRQGLERSFLSVLIRQGLALNKMGFLIRQVAVDEDEGHSQLTEAEQFQFPDYELFDDYQDDDASGIAATDGRWHHVAVTWRSSDGVTCLYDNGRLVTPRPQFPSLNPQKPLSSLLEPSSLPL